MTYWNPIERYGVERFAADLAAAGGAGLITPDLTPDAAPEWIAAADAHGLDKVFLVAPSSTDERIAMTTAGLPRLRLRHRGDGRDRRPRPPPATWPDRSSRAPAPGHRPAGRRRPRRQQRRPGRRGGVVRRRRDRRLAPSSGPSSTTPTTGPPGCARWPR